MVFSSNSSFHCGESSSSRRFPSLPLPSEESFNFDAMFAGVSLQSLLLDENPTVLTFPPPPPPPPPPPNSLFSSDHHHAHIHHHSPFINGHPHLYYSSPLYLPSSTPVFNIPKPERQTPPRLPEFAPNSSTQPTSPFDYPYHFHHLPLLHSLEKLPPQQNGTHKRARDNSSSYPYPTPPPPAVEVGNSKHMMIPGSSLARERRQKVSDKTRCLQRLMPWDKKMDTATLLEEACKYVKFLQAQVCALQSMPRRCACDYDYVPPPQNPMANDNVGAVLLLLGRLNRQQLLQVLVNSPVAQTVLYGRQCCVASSEQLVLLKHKLTAMMTLLRHPRQIRSGFDASSSNNTNNDSRHLY